MFGEKQYFSALAFSHPLLQSLKAVTSKLLGESFEVHKDESHAEIPFLHLYFATNKPYHRIADEITSRRIKVPKTKRIEGITFFLYNCYLMQVATSRGVHFILAAPFKTLLNDCLDANAPMLNSEKLSFYFLRLTDFCNTFETAHYRNIVTVTRINLQVVVGGSKVKSLALYGDDVLLSDAYAQLRVFTIPSAIRMVSEPGDASFAINTDRPGNWSFYLRNKNDLPRLGRLFTTFTNAGILEASFSDPRKRVSSQYRILELE